MNRWKPYLLLVLSVTIVTLAGLDWFAVCKREFHLGATTIAGDKLVTHILNSSQYSDRGIISTQVRDPRSGRVLCLLPKTNLPYPRMLHWWANGEGLAGVEESQSRSRRAFSIRLDEAPQIEYGEYEPNLLFKFSHAPVHQISIYNHTKLNEGWFEVRDSRNSVVEKVDYGPGEIVFAFVSSSRQVRVAVIPTGGSRAKDYVLTDGKQPTYLSFDNSTGKLLWQARGLQAELSGDANCVAIKNAASGCYEIRELSGERVIYEVPRNETPVHYAGDTLISTAEEASSNQQLLVQTNVQTGARKTFQVPTSNRILANGQHAWLSTSDGYLLRFELATGDRQYVANARPRQSITRPVTKAAMPAIWCAWLLWLWLHRDINPFVGTLGLAGCSACTFLIWWQFGATYLPETQRWLAALTQLCIGVTLVIGLIWLTTLRSVDLTMLPIGIIGLTAALLLIHTKVAINAQVFELILVGSGILFWQIVGLFAFVYFFGHIRREHAGVAPQQVSLRQLFVAITLSAVLLALLRTVTLPPGMRWSRCVWALGFGSLFSFACLACLWASFYVRQWWLVVFAWCLPTIAACLAGWTCSEELGITLGDNTLLTYSQPLAATAIVGVALYLAKRAGFTTWHPSAEQSAR